MKRIAKNSVVLFVRQIVMVLISLYTVRLLLQKLGITDFGLMNVTLSVVMLVSFVNGSLSMITERYLAFAIGEASKRNLRRYFDACFSLALLCAITILVILWTLGAWFVTNELVIAPGRFESVTTLYQFLIVYVVLNTFTTLYSSVMIAHEDMHVFAFFTVLQAVLRLGAAVMIGTLGFDILVEYGILLLGALIIGVGGQVLYCLRYYDECTQVRMRPDMTTLREMVTFTRWTLFGQFTTVCRTQAITLLINQGFNPATVAARALSFTIYAQVQAFSQNFLAALNPPITKAYASGDRAETFSLIFFGSRVAFFLSWIVTLPLIALLPGILDIWLGVYPDETVLFTRLALVEGLILSISFPLMTAIRAVGDMRAYELMLGGLQILVLVFSWLLVRKGFPAYSVFIVAILINIAMFFVRLWLANRLVGLNVSAYARSVVLPVGVTAVASAAVVVALMMSIPDSTALALSFVSLAAASAILLSAPVCVYALGLSRGERGALVTMIRARFGRAK